MHIQAPFQLRSANPLATEAPLFLGNDRRRGVSELETASQILAHAVNYLVSEQLAGTRSPVESNREAIALLCAAGRELALEERRRPARRSIAAWLRGAALTRAHHHHIYPDHA